LSVSDTQKGAIAENLIANWLMIGSSGRLSPYKPLADDGGIDLLVYDRQTKRTLLLQVKCRTRTNSMTNADRKTVRLNLRTATFQDQDNFYVAGVLLSSDLHSPEALWLIPSSYVQKHALTRNDKNGQPMLLVVSCSSSADSKDKWSSFRSNDPCSFVEMALQVIDKIR